MQRATRREKKRKGTSGRTYRTGKNTSAGIVNKKTRPASSRRWIERQLNDPYVAEAHRRGLRSRAALKLEQMDRKYHLFAPGQKVLDLGSAPGGWLQIVAERIGSDHKQARLVGVDLLEVKPLPGATVLQGDIYDDDLSASLSGHLGGKADWVISDMAADTTGHRATDHLRTTALLDRALELALEALAPGGGFLAKCFQGGAEADALARMRQAFRLVRHIKPEASRSESVEIYVLATGFRGSPSGEPEGDEAPTLAFSE